MLSTWKKLAAIGLLLAMAGAQAATFPEKPIKLIVPFPPGGGTDAMARLVSQHLGEELGQSIVIDNRGGAGGVIATQAAATSPADGYTLFFATTGTMAINPALYKKSMPLDPIKAFDPIGTAIMTPQVVVVNNALPVSNIKELIALAKAKPGELSFGSSGNGGVVHLVGELFKHEANINITHIPYKGSAPAITDLLGGRISMMFDITPGQISFIKEGRLKALAVTSAARVAALPDTPTIAESGLPGFEATSWFAYVAPRGTPRPVIARLNEALQKVLAKPELRKSLVGLGVEAFPGSVESMAELLRRDTAKWSELVKSSGATVD